MVFFKNPMTGVKTRVFLLAPLVLAGMGLLIGQLYEIQVVNGEAYSSQLQSQSTTSVLLPPARGVIVDRNGIGLAENKASIDLDLYLNVLVGNYLRGHKGKRPLTLAPGTSGRKMTDVAKIVDNTAREEVQSLGLDMSGVTRRDLLRHYDQKPNLPLRLARNLDFNTLSRIAEHNVSVPGLEETARPVRAYNYGAFAAHILGNVGKVEDVPAGATYVPDVIGKDGIEKSMDAWLQGAPGAKVLRKNSIGYILGVNLVREPQSGGTVWLTLDARIQMIVEQEMRGVGRGACVVMSPASGDILAMVSVPSYDPNTYGADLGRLANDATHPLFNRAIGSYAPGSEFKLVTAMAALRNRAINFTPDTVINSYDSWTHASRQWNDWGAHNPGHGAITLKTALQWSTNTFFYQLGVRTGIKSIQATADMVGMGQRLLVDADDEPLLSGESAGVIPGPGYFDAGNQKKLEAWRQHRAENPKVWMARPQPEVWSDGHTINTSIGQGFVKVTPLQLATLMCAVANGGTVFYPRLVWQVTDLPASAADGDAAGKKFPPRKKDTLGLTAAQLRAIQEGLRAVVTGGTGKRAGIREFAVAGKTGTAQFKTRRNGVEIQDNKTWFNSYAPFDQPRYVVTIMVEGGLSGGSTCAPIAAKIYQRIADLENGAAIDLAYLSPAIGHFLGNRPETVDLDAADDTPRAETTPPAPREAPAQPAMQRRTRR
ncbi:MAG: penicillin-binding protein 2 [Verrucomicrobiales bacterium]|jgi:penicillin-binding protein 2|nr:penicillin-binding protein 2 [Verrucomicrobiales bacterium]